MHLLNKHNIVQLKMSTVETGESKRKPGEKNIEKASKGKKRQTGNSKHQPTSSDAELEDEIVGRRAKKPKPGRIGRYDSIGRL